MSDRSSGNDSVAEQLARLDALRDRGSLGEAELEEARRRVLQTAGGSGTIPGAGDPQGFGAPRSGDVEPIVHLPPTDVLPELSDEGIGLGHFPPGSAPLVGSMTLETDQPGDAIELADDLTLDPVAPVASDAAKSSPSPLPELDAELGDALPLELDDSSPLELDDALPPGLPPGPAPDVARGPSTSPPGEPELPSSVAPEPQAPEEPFTMEFVAADQKAQQPPPPQARAVNYRKSGSARLGDAPGSGGARPIGLYIGVGVAVVVAGLVIAGFAGGWFGKKSQGDQGGSKVKTSSPPAAWDAPRPSGPVLCRVVQERLDECEEDWMERFELVVKQKGLQAGAERIATGVWRTAVKQAQTLVFENGIRHRCDAAHRRGQPLEVKWLKALGKCRLKRGCRPFAECHVEVFLHWAGQLGFSCELLCNKLYYQCGKELAQAPLRLRALDRRYTLDGQKADDLKPRKYAACVAHCRKRSIADETREAVLQCIFQPSCVTFLGCSAKL